LQRPVRQRQLLINILATKLYIYGFALGIFDNRISAEATVDHFVVTEKLKDFNGNSLFAVSGASNKIILRAKWTP
jgi:hypothetical protein